MAEPFLAISSAVLLRRTKHFLCERFFLLRKRNAKKHINEIDHTYHHLIIIQKRNKNHPAIPYPIPNPNRTPSVIQKHFVPSSLLEGEAKSQWLFAIATKGAEKATRRGGCA
jgi:hypothetical protein